jgi:hypothetical protein
MLPTGQCWEQAYNRATALGQNTAYCTLNLLIVRRRSACEIDEMALTTQFRRSRVVKAVLRAARRRLAPEYRVSSHCL